VLTIFGHGDLLSRLRTKSPGASYQRQIRTVFRRAVRLAVRGTPKKRLRNASRANLLIYVSDACKLLRARVLRVIATILGGTPRDITFGPVTAEVASSSLVVPAILSKRIPRISLNPSCLFSTSARRKPRELALENVYTWVYIYLGGKSWPSLAYLSPGTAKP
jgi:hypothetical protein